MDSHAFEQDSALSPVRSQPAAAGEESLDDLDAFFQRLSAVEEEPWPERTAPRGMTRGERGGEARAAAQRVVAAVSAQAAGSGQGTGSPQAARTAPGASTAPGAARPTRKRRLLGPTKLAVAAGVLFAAGLGLGWAALSLPGHLVPASASTTPGTLSSVKTPPDPAAVEVPLTEGAAQSAAAPGLKLADAAQPVPQQAATMAVSSAPVSAAPAPVAKARVAVKPKADPAPLAATAAKAPMAPAATPAQAIRSGGFALQVGACRSPSCVERYRELISPHLKGKAGAARLVQVAGDHGQEGLQRLRVEPLDRATALALKDALAQADPRLKSAYLVALP